MNAVALWSQCGALIGSVLHASVVRPFTSKSTLDFRIYMILFCFEYIILKYSDVF